MSGDYKLETPTGRLCTCGPIMRTVRMEMLEILETKRLSTQEQWFIQRSSWSWKSSHASEVNNKRKHRRRIRWQGRHVPPSPPPKKKWGKIFSGIYHVKFGYVSGKYHVTFGNFANFSYIYFLVKTTGPQSCLSSYAYERKVIREAGKSARSSTAQR